MAKTDSPAAAWDKKYLWHPFTQQAEWEKGDPIVVRSAEGARFKDTRGREFIDGVSSLWVNVHGHRHPAIDGAIRRQLGRMSHTTFLGLTHEPAARLGKKLCELSGMDRVFYSDNGATAVEVALKMAYQYWLQTEGRARTQFLALESSYHGDTLGAVSVGGIAHFHKIFRPLLFKAEFALSPHCLACPFRKKPAVDRLLDRSDPVPPRAPKPGDRREETGCRWECLGDVERRLKKGRGRVAAVVAEPLVQAAGGMRVMPPGYMKGLERLCRRNDTFLIADEVATGFGRTGQLFAVQREGVKPDFLCLAKAITGGALPLAATLTSRRVYRAFLGRHEEFKAFFHGHSYTANPLACAAAIASAGLYDRPDFWKKFDARTRALKSALREISRLPLVGHVRQMGFMAGIDLRRPDGAAFPAAARVGHRVCRAALRRGLWTRPLGDTLVVMPPLSISHKDLARLCAALKASIQETARERGAFRV